MPAQAEARAVFDSFKQMLKPTTEQQIRGMLAHWNDVGLAMDGKIDHAEYIAACVEKWLPLPAVFMTWAEEEWIGKSDFFPKPASLVKLAEPYLVKWRQAYSDLDKLAHWEREKPFVKEGTEESRRESARNIRAKIEAEWRAKRANEEPPKAEAHKTKEPKL